MNPATRMPALVLIWAALFASCASTNQYSRAAGRGIAGPGQQRASGRPAGDATASPGTEAAAAQAAAAAREAARQGSIERTGGKPGGGPSGPKARSGTIEIGLVETVNFNGFVGSLGGKGLSQGDTRAQQDAVIKYMNEHGGIGGQSIVPRYTQYDPNNTAPFDAQLQAMCDDWTADNHVFAAVFAWTVEPDALMECMARRKTPLVFGSVPEQCASCVDQVYLQKYPDILYAPTTYEMTSMSKALVTGLVKQSYFGASPKVGLLRWDLPSFTRASDNGLKPALKAAGYTIPPGDEIKVKWPASNSEIGDTASAIQSAVLRFSTDNVTHVLFLDTGFGALATLFMEGAESQQYRPRYGLNSGSRPDTVRQNVNANQLRGALGIGWAPGSDVADPQDPGANAEQTLCGQILSAAGQRSADRNARFVAFGVCSSLFFLKQALEAAPEVSVAGLRAGVDSLDRSYRPAVPLQTRFGPARHFGVASYRLLAYADTCSCFEYRGDVQPSE